MKKILSLILCVLMLTVSLCACGEDDPSAGGTEDGSVNGESWIDRQLAEAERLYAWFTGCGKPACDTAAVRESDGTVYNRVTEPGLSTAADLRGRLSELFEDNIVQSLMETVVYSGAPMFREFDGLLYYCGGVPGQVPWDIGERTGTLISQSESEIIYHLEINHSYYSSSYTALCDYRLVLGDDGQWRFASFRLPALLIAEQMFEAEYEE